MSDMRDGGGSHGHPGGMHGRAWSREEAVAVLESPDRRATQNPVALWDAVGLRPGETVVDVGAGTGFFALPAAERVGPEGRVYAVDLSAELVALIEERARRRGLPAVRVVQSTPDRIPLPDRIADVVLLANVLHDIPRSTLTEAVRLLRADGRMVNVDWKKAETPGGPPVEVRLSPAEAVERLRAAGLVVKRQWEIGPYHYALLLHRAAPEAETGRVAPSSSVHDRAVRGPPLGHPGGEAPN
ncbi:MAG: methyltransferase domain-containing protein [Thermoplasmata archaeon]